METKPTVTDTQIQAWKNQYGEINIITVRPPYIWNASLNSEAMKDPHKIKAAEEVKKLTKGKITQLLQAGSIVIECAAGVFVVRSGDVDVKTEVAEGKKEAVGYFRKPDTDDLAISRQFVQSDPVKAGEVLMNNCFLGGDETFIKDRDVMMAAVRQIGDIVELREAELKKS